uniref:RNA methyltransferase substrate-binding domain-containing protein n=1 Tax=Devosia sp. TaxID=1871048 RepID=UPI002FC5BD05
MSQLEKIYGVHAVEALLRHHPKRVKQVWLAEGRSDPRVQVLLELAGQARVAVGQCERREMDAWVEGVHQGVVAEVSPSQVWGEAMLEELLDRAEGPPLLLVLDGVTDPHNL